MSDQNQRPDPEHQVATLRDDDIVTRARVDRRTWVRAVVMAAVAIGVTTRESRATVKINDEDSGPNADPEDRGRGGGTDRDRGPHADKPGRGRGLPPSVQGLTDNDTGPNEDVFSGPPRPRPDAPPRLWKPRSPTDEDSPPNADPSGRGRRSATAITDRDTGPNADPRGYGQGGSKGVTDRDQGPSADLPGRGRGDRPK